MKQALALIGLAFSAACNGGGNGVVTDPPSVGEINERLERADTMRDRVLGYAGTSWDSIPDVGSADFKGMGRAVIDQTEGSRSDDVTIVGYLQMTADFEDGTIDGTLTNMQGHTGRAPRSGNVFDVDGRIRIGNRASDLERRPIGATNIWSANYGGSVDTPEGEIDMRGELEGRFRGTRVSASGTEASIRSLYGSDDDGRATVDGRRAAGFDFEVFGLNN